MLSRLTALLLCALAGTAASAGETPPLTTFSLQAYTTRNGLASNLVSNIAQDPSGYLWLTTPEGLVRYDGVEFATFDRRTQPELRSNAIGSVALDAAGAVWLGTAAGRLYRLQGARLEQVRLPARLAQAEIVVLAFDPAGSLWIGTRGGLCRLEGRAMECFTEADGLPSTFIGSTPGASSQAIAFEADGTVWVVTNAGLAVRRGGRFTPLAFAPGEIATAVTKDQDGAIWAGTNRGRLGTVDARGFHPRLEMAPVLVSTLVPRKSEVWFGTTGNGIGRWDGQQVEWLNRAAGLPGDEVLALFADREENLWAATTLGLARLSDPLIAQYGELHGLLGPIVSSVAPGRRGVWVVTDNGQLQLFEEGRFSRAKLTGDALPGLLRRVLEARDGSLWLGTRQGLAHVVDGRVAVEKETAGVSVAAIYEDREGAIWVGTPAHGLLRRDRNGWRRWGPEQGLPDTRVFTMHQTRDGVLWVGTSRGLARIADERVTSYGPAEGLPDPLVVALHEDSQGTLWLGTVSEGLVRFQDGRFTAISQAQGLPDTTVWAILEDHLGSFWLSSNRGINRITRADLQACARGERDRLKTAVRYGPAEGLLEPDCLGGFLSAGAVTANGWLCFATSGGLAIVHDPSRATADPPPPALAVVSAIVDGQLQPPGSVNVPASGRRVEVRLAAPTFRSPERVRFRYRLLGFDERWQDIGIKREIVYTNPPVGQLTLEAAASRDGERWGEALRLPVNVQPRWFQTLWFRGLVIVAFAVVGPGFYRYRMWQGQRREAALAHVVAERTEELRRANLRLEDKYRQLAELSISDSLTGLANRRRFDSALGEEWRRAVRHHGWLSLVVLDIDHFKALNDSLGHPAGDACLRAMGGVLAALPRRAGDLIARVGGDEFCLLLPGSTPADAAAVAENVRAAMADAAHLHPASPLASYVTVSAGTGSAQAHAAAGPEALVTAADEALYEAKRAGRNRVASRLVA